MPKRLVEFRQHITGDAADGSHFTDFFFFLFPDAIPELVGDQLA
ncbi:hypothetical protein [Planococcus koreensis]|nr:hypothetical protein [Planococcus koreensis]